MLGCKLIYLAMKKLKNKLKELPLFFSLTQKSRNLVFNLLKTAKAPTLSIFETSLPPIFRQPTFFSFLFGNSGRMITKKTIRIVEKKSIREFLEKNKNYLRGRVLDFGAGQQPYKDLVEGEYVSFEKGDLFPEGSFDAVLITQVAQYLPDPIETFGSLAKKADHLIMTYPTNWEEVEGDDLHRFTKVGMERILEEAGFEIMKHTPRCAINFDDFQLTIGYGVIAKSRVHS